MVKSAAGIITRVSNICRGAYSCYKAVSDTQDMDEYFFCVLVDMNFEVNDIIECDTTNRLSLSPILFK